MLAPSALGATIVFSDTEFADADWSLTVLAFRDGVANPAGGSASAPQVASGGNPGAFRRTDLTVNASGPLGALVVAASFRNGASYDPQTQGTITSIDFAIDGTLLSTFTQNLGLALRQGGQIYFTAGFLPAGAWESFQATGLTESDFSQCGPSTCPVSGNPDFSASGGSIDFGYVALNSLGGTNPAFSTQVGADNWSVTIVPEPSTVVLLALGLLALGCRRRSRAPCGSLSTR
jgi:hypothetical protein